MRTEIPLSLYALVDCNNFYVSCERLFNPKLEGRAVIVLSNNDGCAVSRSAEAKALGIKMGVPLFNIKDLVKSGKVTAFSSNYALYWPAPIERSSGYVSLILRLALVFEWPA